MPPEVLPPEDSWTAIIYVLAGLALLGCNFFFVMSEFAIVKLRDSQIAALALANDPRATILRHIKTNLDEYLAVVQVGITGATIGMGIVIDEVIGQMVRGWCCGGLVSARRSKRSAARRSCASSAAIQEALTAGDRAMPG